MDVVVNSQFPLKAEQFSGELSNHQIRKKFLALWSFVEVHV